MNAINEQKSETTSSEATGSALPVEAVLEEHREMCFMLMRITVAVWSAKAHFNIPDNDRLVTVCSEIERWLDAHQSDAVRTDFQRLTWLQDTLTSIGFNSEVNAWGVDFDAPFAPTIRQAIDAAMDALPNDPSSATADTKL